MAEEKQEQTPVDYQEQLQKSEFYKLASGYGVDLSGYKADSEDAVKAALDEIKKATKEKMLEGASYENDILQTNSQGLDKATEHASEEEKEKLKQAYDDLRQEIADQKKKEKEQNNKREDMTLEDADKGDQKDENQDLEWIEKKRQAWKEFAIDVSKEVEEKEAVDPVQYSVGLKDVQGRVDYTSETSAGVTQDADFLLYKGLVRDAAKSNLNIKIGDTLTGPQKLMLYTAVLSSTETYPNGEKLSLIGAPQIDHQSPDYQSLPDDVKKILEKELKRQQENQGQGQQQQQQQQQEQKPNEATEKEKIAAMAKSLGIKDLPQNPEEALKQIDEGIKKAGEFAGVKLPEMDTIEKREAVLKGISSQIISDLSEITGKPVTEVQSNLPLPRLMKDFETYKKIEAQKLAKLSATLKYDLKLEGKGADGTKLTALSLSDYKKIRTQVVAEAVAKGWTEIKESEYGVALSKTFTEMKTKAQETSNQNRTNTNNGNDGR